MTKVEKNITVYLKPTSMLPMLHFIAPDLSFSNKCAFSATFYSILFCNNISGKTNSIKK